MNYHKIEKTSVANGPGVRVTLWVSGCKIGCHNCQNPQTWSFNSGKLFDSHAKQELFEALNHSYIQGITFSGGHPLEYENLPEVYDLIKDIREKYPDKDIWLYTGYVLSINDFDTSVDICWDNSLLRNYILSMCDVIVDGPYIEEQRDITLKFRGSKNQRLIDVSETLKQNKIITIQN
jgi:anaerobic ribonucleoside-triphosphate reductase activating protein